MKLIQRRKYKKRGVLTVHRKFAGMAAEYQVDYSKEN